MTTVSGPVPIKKDRLSSLLDLVNILKADIFIGENIDTLNGF
jgi:hypothetical protein